MMPKITRERCKAAEAAAMLGVCSHTVCRMAVLGKLPSAAKIGGSWTFNIKALQIYIAEQEAAVVANANWRPPVRVSGRYNPPVQALKSAEENRLEMKKLLAQVLNRPAPKRRRT